MSYLSPQIGNLIKRKKQEEKSLIKRGNSCGIFQDYENTPEKHKNQRL